MARIHGVKPYDAAEMASVVESVLEDRDKAAAKATTKVVSTNRAKEA